MRDDMVVGSQTSCCEDFLHMAVIHMAHKKTSLEWKFCQRKRLVNEKKQPGVFYTLAPGYSGHEIVKARRLKTKVRQLLCANTAKAFFCTVNFKATAFCYSLIFFFSILVLLLYIYRFLLIFVIILILKSFFLFSLIHILQVFCICK